MGHTCRLGIVMLVSSSNESSDVDPSSAHLLADECRDTTVRVHEECSRVANEGGADQPSGGNALKREEGELLEGQGGGVWCSSKSTAITQHVFG